MNCRWQIIDGTDDDRGWVKTRCSRCQYVTAPWPARDPDHKHHRTCPLPGWGDYLAHFFVTWLGVSKERFSGWVRLIHDQPSCGCQKRQDNLNEVGWKFERLWRWLTLKMKLRR